MYEKRIEQIIELLQDKNFITVEEFTGLLKVSAATVRRDLAKMERDNLIVRYRGGARVSDESVTEESMSIKRYKNIDEKNSIGKYAASLIRDHNIVYMDAGSTTYQMIEHITAKDITIVTVGIPHVLALSKKKIRTFLLGGFVKNNTEAVTGVHTISMIQNYNFDLAFVGANGIHKSMGYTTPEAEEGEVKKLAIKNSGKAFVLADVSKMNHLCFVSYAALSEATLITDVYGDFNYHLMDVVAVNETGPKPGEGVLTHE